MKENGNQKHFFISIIQNTIPKKSVNQKKCGYLQLKIVCINIQQQI